MIDEFSLPSKSERTKEWIKRAVLDAARAILATWVLFLLGIFIGILFIPMLMDFLAGYDTPEKKFKRWRF